MDKYFIVLCMFLLCQIGHNFYKLFQREWNKELQGGSNELDRRINSLVELDVVNLLPEHLHYEGPYISCHKRDSTETKRPPVRDFVQSSHITSSEL